MALTTYTELKASVADWLNRTDLTTEIPDFISLAEAQMERTLRTRQMLTRTTLTVDSEFETTPADFLEVRALKLTSTNPDTPLSFMTMDSLDDEATRETGGGRPKFFGVVGTEFRFVPTPDAAYTAEIVYFANLNKLSASVATNFLLTSSPDAYLYGALLQAAPYLQDDARIQVWATLYERALNDLQVADDRGSTTGGKLITRAKTFG
jgi:hypothetical protein